MMGGRRGKSYSSLVLVCDEEVYTVALIIEPVAMRSTERSDKKSHYLGSYTYTAYVCGSKFC